MKTIGHLECYQGGFASFLMNSSSRSSRSTLPTHGACLPVYFHLFAVWDWSQQLSFASHPRPLVVFRSCLFSIPVYPFHVHILPDGLSTLSTAGLSPRWLPLVIDLRPDLRCSPSCGMKFPLCSLWVPAPASPLLGRRHPVSSGISLPPGGGGGSAISCVQCLTQPYPCPY